MTFNEDAWLLIALAGAVGIVLMLWFNRLTSRR
jgi:hypothetical protein